MAELDKITSNSEMSSEIASGSEITASRKVAVPKIDKLSLMYLYKMFHFELFES